MKKYYTRKERNLRTIVKMSTGAMVILIVLVVVINLISQIL